MQSWAHWLAIAEWLSLDVGWRSRSMVERSIYRQKNGEILVNREQGKREKEELIELREGGFGQERD
jgi:hypothetical protein